MGNKKVISIHQPWASLIVEGIKDIENRSWKTNYRGTILIHAGAKKLTTKSSVNREDLIKKGLTENNIMEAKSNDFNFARLQYSAIIGQVDIIDCVINHSSSWAMEDCWHWVLANPVKFDKPIENVKGKLMLWNFDI